MINHLLYIVGAPGVGKSTLARELTSGWDRYVNRLADVPHTVLSHPASDEIHGVELGVPRADFPGTDALSMSIGPRALAWLRELPAPFALGEGTRLATRPFLGGLVQAGVKVTVVSLSGTQELLDARWRARGAVQNGTWRKGALTRAERVYEWAVAEPRVTTLRLEADGRGAAVLADEVRDAFPLIDLRELQP